MTSSKKTKEKEEIDKKIILRINYHVPENLITRFASNMTIQNIDNDFKVSFFELMPDIYIKDSGEEPPKEIKAECVASVIITADRMQKFIDLLQKQLDRQKS